MCRSVNQWFGEEYLNSFEDLVEGLDLVVVEDVFPSLDDLSEVDQVVFA